VKRTMPIITIPVELSNPGQFFACCGLLELANRMWPESLHCGIFTTRDFQIESADPAHTLRTLIEAFTACEVAQLDPDDNAASPLQLGPPFGFRLDWWTKYKTPKGLPVDYGGGDHLKTWAGQQFGPLIFRLMKAACADMPLQAPLDVSKAIHDCKDGKAKKKTISPFYFDARREGTSLDIGFSPDEQGMSVMAYPAVESLALVGLQRFRPYVEESTRPRSFAYTAWAEFLPPSVAAAAVCGMINVQSQGIYRFTKPSRGGEYVTMFSRATRERSEHVRPEN